MQAKQTIVNAMGWATLALLLAFMPMDTKAQRQTYTTTETKDLATLSNSLLGPGVIISPMAPEGGSTHGNQSQIGIFSGLHADPIPFTSGVIISTGNIRGGASIVNPSLIEPGLEYNDSLGDLDLGMLFPNAANDLFDSAHLILHVVPSNSTINIPFVFASEEYFFGAQTYDEPDVDSMTQVSDRFAFFVEPGIVHHSATSVNFTNNIARLPSGDPTEIASVNQHVNTEYFIANVETNEYGELICPTENIPLPMSYNGATIGPVAYMTGLTPGATYTIKLVIADQKDREFDSTVFLKEKGITSGADLAVEVVASPKAIDATNAEANKRGTYTVTVSNVGPIPATDVVLTNHFPVGAVCTDTEYSPDADGVMVIEVGTLEAGESVTYEFHADFSASESGEYTDVAEVGTPMGDYDPSNNKDEDTIVVTALTQLVITGPSTNKVYGTSIVLDSTDFTVSGLKSGEGDRVDSITLVCPEAEDVTASVGTYTIEVTDVVGTGLDKYVVTVVPGVLTVLNAPLTITANDTNKVYGVEIEFEGTEFTVTGLQPGDTVTSATIASEGAVATAGVGTYPITISDAVGTGLDNYTITYVPGTLTVTEAELTITANDATKVYGDTVTFAGTEFTVSGLQPGDAVTSATIASTGAAATAGIGTYPITISDAVGTGLDNYTITYVPGTLTVTQAELTITANDATKVYGDAMTFAGTEFTVTGLQTGDTVTSATIASEGADATAAIGTYPITISDAVGTGLQNYVITYEPGTLTVTGLELVITANDTNKVYGASISFAGTEFTVTGLQPGDTVTSATIASEGAVASAAVGTYPITISDAVGTGLDNYTITYVPGTLTVTEAGLTITANDATKVYGDTVTFAGTEFTVSGLQPGDAVTSATIASTGAPASAAVGTYPITISDAVGTGLENYTITYVPGTLMVTEAELTITANDATKVYGDTVTFAGTEFTVSGLQTGDAVTSATIASTGAPASAAVGTYPITISDAVGTGLENYTITYVPGTLTVTQAELTITANDATKVYGDTVTFAGTEFTVSGLLSGDAVTSATIASVGAAASAAVGTYPITISDAVGTGLENYAITYVPGTLTVTQAELTITANDATKVYGDAVTFAGTEFTVSGLLSGDAVTSATIASEGAAASAAVGTYPITIADAVGTGLENYTITYVPGTLTVTKGVLEIRVKDATRQVGGPNPAFAFDDFSASLKAGDTMADIVGGSGTSADVVFDLATTDASSPVGIYADEILLVATSVDGPKVDNYTIELVPGTLTIVDTAPDLWVTAKWTLNFSTGLFDGVLTIKNVGDGDIPAGQDYWFAVTNVETSRLDTVTGDMPDGRTYLNLTDPVRAALRGTGNGDEVWNPGETITLSGILWYHLKRINPSRYLDVNAAFEYGQLFNSADLNTNFRVEASEFQQASEEWREGRLTTKALIDSSRLRAEKGYVWDKHLKTWRAVQTNEVVNP